MSPAFPLQTHLITGFALDRRILESLHLPRNRFICHDLISPHPDETLPEYALRMAESIGFEKGDEVGGLSLGGMVALEIARQCGASRLYLLASCTHPRFIRFPFRILARISLWLPDGFSHAVLIRVPALLRWLGLHTAKNSIELSEIISSFPKTWIRIFTTMIFSWKGCEPAVPFTALHSQGDWTIRPPSDLAGLTLLPGRDHLIPLSRHDACRNFLLQDPEPIPSKSGEIQSDFGSGRQ